MVNGCQICSTHSRPQEAEVGLLCERCVQALRQTIVDLELCLLAISAVPGKSGPQAEPVSGNNPGSRSPANDNAIIHTDLRTAWSQEDGFGAFSVLHEWAVEAREHEGVEPPERITVTSESQALQNALRQIAGADWIVDASEEIKAAYRAVRRVVGLSPEKPVGPCKSTDCSGRVVAFENRARCHECLREYGGLSLAEVRQGASLDPMDRIPTDVAIKALADYGKPMTAKGLRNWLNRGYISYASGWDMLEILEHINQPKDRQ